MLKQVLGFGIAVSLLLSGCAEPNKNSNKGDVAGDDVTTEDQSSIDMSFDADGVGFSLDIDKALESFSDLASSDAVEDSQQVASYENLLGQIEDRIPYIQDLIADRSSDQGQTYAPEPEPNSSDQGQTYAPEPEPSSSDQSSPAYPDLVSSKPMINYSCLERSSGSTEPAVADKMNMISSISSSLPKNRAEMQELLLKNDKSMDVMKKVFSKSRVMLRLNNLSGGQSATKVIYEGCKKVSLKLKNLDENSKYILSMVIMKNGRNIVSGKTAIFTKATQKLQLRLERYKKDDTNNTTVVDIVYPTDSDTTYGFSAEGRKKVCKVKSKYPSTMACNDMGYMPSVKLKSSCAAAGGELMRCGTCNHSYLCSERPKYSGHDTPDVTPPKSTVKTTLTVKCYVVDASGMTDADDQCKLQFVQLIGDIGKSSVKKCAFNKFGITRKSSVCSVEFTNVDQGDYVLTATQGDEVKTIKGSLRDSQYKTVIFKNN